MVRVWFSNGSRSYENWENRITLKEANDPLALVGTRERIPSSVIFKMLLFFRVYEARCMDDE